MRKLDFIPFKPKYATVFRDLNIAWLKKYFYVEEKDSLLLENCEESIINTGGFIFFAKLDNVIVGCLSYIKIEEGVYELGKMAVDENYQGQKIGQALLNYALMFAKESKWNTITLYSNTKLKNAIHIYKKIGFVVVKLEDDLPYLRSDIKMELYLN